MREREIHKHFDFDAFSFICPKLVLKDDCGEGDGGGGSAGQVVDGGVLEEVQHFCYLGDMLDCEAGVERAVRARMAAAWRIWCEMVSLLVNHTIELNSRGNVYEACVRSALLYRGETWALKDRLMDLLRNCDHRMLRYMAGVRLQDRRSNKEVAEMCGVEDLSVKLRTRRLRWFGHVKRAREGALGEVREMRVGGRRPVRRPRKEWSECVREDMNVLGIEEDMAQNWEMWRTVIARPTPF